ncbi:hypothetical protein LXA43DRAFT_617333 [Ganoderma leucocontextum]|nr:hypothetical protein LXA43DRAFT_617333 [Ganoderma leucocontextum]
MRADNRSSYYCSRPSRKYKWPSDASRAFRAATRTLLYAQCRFLCPIRRSLDVLPQGRAPGGPLNAAHGTINKAGKSPFMVLARRAYSTSISTRTIHPQIAPPIGLPTLTSRVDGPIWTSGSHAVDAKAPLVTAHPALYDVYSIGVYGWPTSDYSALVPVVSGVALLLAALVYLLYTSNRRRSKRAPQKQSSQPSQIVDRAVSAADVPPNISHFCLHPCSACIAAQRGVVDDQVVRTIPTDFDRICAELVQLRKDVDALVVRISKANETLHELNATHEELRDILESIKDRSPSGSPDGSTTSSWNPWSIPPDHDAFANAHFFTAPSCVEGTVPQRNSTALDDDSKYLSTALGLTDWSDVPPRNGYYPTLDLLLSRSERGSPQEAWYVPSEELRAWIFPTGAFKLTNALPPATTTTGCPAPRSRACTG